MLKQICIVATVIASTVASAQFTKVSYTDGKQKLNGLSLSAKQSSEKPGILILPAWKGINANEKEAALRLQTDGYNVFIADIYGEGNYPQSSEAAGKIAGFYKTNYTDYQRRIQLALDQLIKQGANADNIVAMGYCFGGTGVLEAARAGMKLKGIASFHGGLGKSADRPNGKIAPKVLILHGADDPYESKEEIADVQQEMRSAKADWQMIYFGNAVHAFTDREVGDDNATGAAYNELADKRSWKYFMLFLNETLTK